MMKLTNRGINSERIHGGAKFSTLPLELKSEIENYSQQDHNYRYPRHISQRLPQLRQPCRVSAPTSKVDSVVETKLVFFKRSGQAQAIAKTHLDNIRRSLERRLQVAIQSGDSHLVNLLENECKQIDVG